MGRTLRELIPDVAEGVEPQFRQVIETGQPIIGGTVEAKTPAQPGLTRTFQHNFYPISSGDGTVVGVSCVVEDITERKRTEEALRESEERFKDIAESTGDRLWEMDGDFRFTFVSDSYDKTLEPKRDLAIGKTPWEIVGEDPDEDETWRWHRDDLLARRPFRGFEYQAADGAGEVTRWSISGVPVFDGKGIFRGYRGAAVDITERQRAEDKIKASLAEKEVLLQEIHHRVKNNLQVITSMLSLQAGTETDNHAIEALKESQRQVGVMARIHETLHQSDDLASVNARDYLNTLVEDTKASSGQNAQGISFHLEADDIIFDADHAVPCGQIISELLSNSLKHAFPDGQSGNVEVSLHRRDGGKIELTVADDGTGLAEGFDLQRAETLGMRLVHALAMKLRGDIEVDGSGGTRVQITFPE